ncbi:MAG: glycosyltransferase family 4 protein [Deltaproteobacteria bacterium]
MRIALTTVQVPFIRGGAESLARGLADALVRAGHEAEIVSAPFRFAPSADVRRSMDFWEHEDFGRFDSGPIDAVVCLKFPTYYLQHPRRIVWLLHQHRAVYELFDTPYGIESADTANVALRAEIVERDTRHLASASAIFTLSRRVSERLMTGNGVQSAPLHHPPPDAEAFYCRESLPYIFFPSRLEALKRQELLIRAMRHVRAPVSAIVAGDGGSFGMLAELVERLDLHARVRLLGGVERAEMLAWYANALGVFFGPYDEDYGYVTLEAMLASKPVITCTDSGGPLEFVVHGETGFVVSPLPEAVADAIDTLYANRGRAIEMGRAGRGRYRNLGIAWASVVETLLRPPNRDAVLVRANAQSALAS